MPPKKIHAFCDQQLLCPWAEYNNYNSLLPAACSEAPLTYMALSAYHVIGSFSEATSEDTQLRASLSYSEEHIEDIGRTIHIYF